MSDLRHLDLSSKGITKTYYATQARVHPLLREHPPGI